MKNSQDIQDIITDLWSELKETLECFDLEHVDSGDPYQQIWTVNGRNIEFTVYATIDAKDTPFRVEIHAETDDQKDVIQAAKAFKSTYL